MESPAIVEVIEHCRVAPPPGSVPTTSISLTYLDLPWFMVPPVERVFFYKFHHPKEYFFDSVVPNLKHSLSLTLQHFFPLVGNLTWPHESHKPEILYTQGDTISFTVAESAYDFHALSGNQARSAPEFCHLVPSFETPPPTNGLIPLMCLQVTLFPGSGVCIGISVNHVCADGRTSNHFLKSWAAVFRSQGGDGNGDGKGDISLLFSMPVYGRPVMTDQKKREEIVVNGNQQLLDISKESFNCPISPTPSADNVRITFVMRPADLTKLRHWVMSRITNKELWLSSFVLTCAYVWVCLIKSQQQQSSGTSCKERFVFVIDCRDRLIPPLPITYFGNCFGFGIATSTTDEMVQENGVAVAAELIVKAIQETRTDIWGSVERLYSVAPVGKRASEEAVRVMSVAGSPKLAVYGTDFGWGKPKKVEVISIGERGSISLSECPGEEGALEIGLVGSKEGMDAFTALYVNNLSSLPSPND